MTDAKINLNELRAEITAPSGHPMVYDDDTVLALIDAVEAARDNAAFHGGSNPITHRLAEALARFDPPPT